MGPERLSTFPYVVVRIACSKCGRSGSYRLARLAERYGADCTIHALIVALSANCPTWIAMLSGAPSAMYYDRCEAALRDPAGPGAPPPDLPPEMRRLRIVGGR